MKLEGKVAIVTGASRGMGYSHALALAREGANIAAIARSECKVINEVRKLGLEGIGIKCDVSKNDEVRAMVDRVLTELGRIDILVNNAGILAISLLVDTEEGLWDRVLDTNLKGTFLCCKYVIPHMIKQRSGKIINIASINAKYGVALGSAYCASKFGIVGFTESLAQEVAAYNINVNAVGPGFVKTAMVAEAANIFPKRGQVSENYYEETIKEETLFGREITTQDVSNAVVWLASEESRNITGQLVLVDGGHPSSFRK
jgi:NAD(P)-dependent dehydrogenase (short-subunit alcohol dehydrogenase family)